MERQYNHPGPSNYYHQQPPPPNYPYGYQQYHYPYPPPGPSTPHHRPPYLQQRPPYPQSPYSQTPPHPHPLQQPYSPVYAPFHPSSPYTPPWANQNTISPLPKHISMAPVPTTTTPIPESNPRPDYTLRSPAPPLPPVEPEPEQLPPPSSLPSHPSSPAPTRVFSPTIEPSSVPEVPTSTQDEDPAESPQVQTSIELMPSRTEPTAPSGDWVIWSRRPKHPTDAFGVMFSPRTRPPHYIVTAALKLTAPPHSPPPPKQQELEPEPKPEEQAELSSTNVEPSTEAVLVSSAATETTPETSMVLDTPATGSPRSSNTSLSVPVTPSNTSKAATNGVKAVESTEAQQQPQEPETKAPAPRAPPPMKKSWASLLRSSSPSTSALASTSRSTLPTSNVVGISIPSASAPPPPTTQPNPELLTLLTTGPSSSQAPIPRIRLRGLVNSGNMCFANAVLQVLVYTLPFYRLFSELDKLLVGPVVGQKQKGTPLVDAVISFLKEFVIDEEKEKRSNQSNGRGHGKGKEVDREEQDEPVIDSFLPTYVYDATKENRRFDHMRGGQQEDAEEFLGFFLDTLEEELLSISNSLNPTQSKKDQEVVEEKEEEEPSQQEDGWYEVGKKNRSVVTRTVKTSESPITKIFGGKSRSTLRAPHQKDSVVIEDWRSLRLDIQHEGVSTISDALRYLSHPQSIQMTQPSRPGVTIEASQQTLIEALPSILVLHLKRFLYDTKVGDVVKVSKQIRFGPELEIGGDMMTPARRAQGGKYKLFGVVYHHGLYASGGHYTLDVLHPNRDLVTSPAKPREAWIRIDDELLSDVRPEDVFGGPGDREDRCAYLLLYRRVAPSRA